jgi:hypothetical protein
MDRRRFVLMLAASSLLHAADFSLTIGGPVAAGLVTKVKRSVFAVRLEQCENLAKSQITGTAEGIANSARKSVPVQLASTVSPSVFVVPATWADEGAWVVTLKATCADAKAGAIVPIGRGGFIRESLKVFPRFATAAEVEASLKALMGDTK